MKTNNLTKEQKKRIITAVEKLQQLSRNAQGKISTCCAFDEKPSQKHDVITSREIRHSVDLYIRSWVIPELTAISDFIEDLD